MPNVGRPQAGDNPSSRPSGVPISTAKHPSAITRLPGETHLDALARLLDLESRAAAERIAAAARRLRGEAAERTGLSLVELALVDEDLGLGGRTLLTFVKRNRTRTLPWSRLGPGSPVVVAPDDPHDCGQGRGVVVRIDEHEVRVALDDNDDLPDGDLWRLDASSDEVAVRRQRDALHRAQRAASGRLAKLRDILLGDAPPRFDAPRPIEPLNDALNAGQRAAVAWALGGRDVALLHGPPGTGKTTTLVELIRQAVRRGEKVLACAPSNLGVDNLLERLNAAGVPVVRLGHPARVIPALRERTLDLLVENHPDIRVARQLVREARSLFRQASKTTRAKPAPGARRAQREEARQQLAEARQLEEAVVNHLLDAAPVIGATTTALDPSILGDRSFEWAVIDEACQSTEPGCWLPVQRCQRLLLAGDHCQLPPTVISPEAAKGGFGVSLFERLIDRWGPAAARRLDEQYRMHATIAEFSSREFYDGGLIAHPAVADHRLADLPGVDERPATTSPLEFIDTSGAGHDEQREPDGESLFNPGEAELAIRLVRDWMAAGVDPREIGVIAPYAAQVRFLRERLRVEGLEIDTVDGFQGREKEALLVTLVRSNPRGEIGFLGDVRRLNVALTRARRRLTVIGDLATLAGDPFFARWGNWVESCGAYRSIWELDALEE